MFEGSVPLHEDTNDYKFYIEGDGIFSSTPGGFGPDIDKSACSLDAWCEFTLSVPLPETLAQDKAITANLFISKGTTPTARTLSIDLSRVSLTTRFLSNLSILDNCK